MDVEKLQKLAERYPEVQELLKDNYSLSVAILAARLQVFDANHTRAQARLADLIKQLDVRLQSSAIFSRDLKKRVKKLETEAETETV